MYLKTFLKLRNTRAFLQDPTTWNAAAWIRQGAIAMIYSRNSSCQINLKINLQSYCPKFPLKVVVEALVSCTLQEHTFPPIRQLGLLQMIHAGAFMNSLQASKY